MRTHLHFLATVLAGAAGLATVTTTSLSALAFATADSAGYIVGANGRWLIVSDMDN